MAHKMPFIVAEVGPDCDPFMLHIYAATRHRVRPRTPRSASSLPTTHRHLSGNRRQPLYGAQGATGQVVATNPAHAVRPKHWCRPAR
jgi:hypothetical protein